MMIKAPDESRRVNNGGLLMIEASGVTADGWCVSAQKASQLQLAKQKLLYIWKRAVEKSQTSEARYLSCKQLLLSTSTQITKQKVWKYSQAGVSYLMSSA